MLFSSFTRRLLLILFSLGFSVVNAQTWQAIKNWQYTPQNEGFWLRMESLQKSSSLTSDLLEQLLKQTDSKVFSNLKSTEIFLAVADVMQETGFSQGAFGIYLEIIKKHPGTALAQKALYEIEHLLHRGSFDEEELARVLNQGAFVEIPDSVLTMVQYYSVVDDMKKGLANWNHSSIKALSAAQDHWGQQFRYYLALESYRGGMAEKAAEDLQELSQMANLEVSIGWKIQWQRARLHFEKMEYEKADEIYYHTAFPQRVQGRALLERAWAKYHQRDFGHALGILESLKTPSSKISASPEQYLLAMMIYRELCHYSNVVALAREFQRRFQTTYDLIRASKPLTQNMVIMWQALQLPQYRSWGEIVDSTQKEQKRFISLGFQKMGPAGAWIANYYSKSSKEIPARLEHWMTEDIRRLADEFLEGWDQVKLAEYISNLDEYRIEARFEQRKYEVNQEERQSYDVLYWPVKGEFWIDELKNYHVLITDRCEEGRGGRK